MRNIDFEAERTRLVNKLTAEGFIRSPALISALKSVPREEFVPPPERPFAYEDRPLPILESQTISAPHMVGMMCEALELQEGQKVLEIGTGSGYHAAVLAEIVAPRRPTGASSTPSAPPGHVYTVEFHRSLVEFARENLSRTGYGDRVTVVEGDGSQGLAEFSPYHRILVTAAAPDVPRCLLEQLLPEGVLVIPVGGHYFFQDLLVVRKAADGRVTHRSVGSVAFVPLLGKFGWKDYGG